MNRPPRHRRNLRPNCVLGIALLATVCAGPACASSASTAGPLTVDPPTLHCIGVRWVVSGDANNNAAVRIEFRRTGKSGWRRGMDLFRVETAAMRGESLSRGAQLFAGSVFDLIEDAEYELRLTLSDPDGGGDTRRLKARTWAEPRPPAPRRVLHVGPGAAPGDGTRRRPFGGIARANKAARPGDLILVHAGVYPGQVAFTRSGTADAPIVWRGAGDGEGVFEGPPGRCCAHASGLKHVFFERLAFRKCERAMSLQDSSYVTVRRCRFTDLGSGIGAGGRQERLFIADCVFKGRRTWPRQGNDSKMGEHRGVELSGIGHVIAYNRISGFRDGVDTRPGFPVRGIDIHNNDISECTDDGIELDYSQSNCGAVRNRITNCFMGVSFQPSLGGPNYAIRNAMYNLGLETFKLHVSPPGRISSGGVLLHNTAVRTGAPLRVWAGGTPVHHYFLRNNLFVARNADRAMDMQCRADFPDWDYDLYAGGPFRIFAKYRERVYATREAFAKATGQEAHGTVTPAVKGLFASKVLPPTGRNRQFLPAVNDLRLAPGSEAVDKGQALPNVNDGFKGRAPDVGAFELGEPLPQYGPRAVRADRRR